MHEETGFKRIGPFLHNSPDVLRGISFDVVLHMLCVCGISFDVVLHMLCVCLF